MVAGLLLVICFAHVKAYSIYGVYSSGPTNDIVQSEPRKDFRFECPKGQVINAFKSQLSECDRQWGFSCAPVEGVLDKCIFSEFQNVGDGIYDSFDFECPDHGALVGVDTVFMDSLNERKYRFKCCATSVTVGKIGGKRAPVRAGMYTECQEFQTVPELGGSFHVDIPYGFVCLRWRADRYLPPKEDRFHSVQCCRLSRCKGCKPYSAYPPYFKKGPSYPIPSPTVPPKYD